jgi:serine/threonine protein kinase
MNGGEYLGSGTYGCIFYPAIRCKNGKQLDGVGKIFSDDDEQKVESNVGKKTRTVDPQGSFLNILTDECDVTKAEILRNDPSKQCKHLSSLSTTYNQLIYKEKGMDLDKFIRRNKRNYCLFDQVIIDYVTNLLKGVQLMQDHRLAHMDIKPENILVTDNTNKLLLIDFGLTRPFQDIYDTQKSDYLMRYSYHIYPPEFKVFMVMNMIKRKPWDVTSDDYYTTLQKKVIKKYYKHFEGLDGYSFVVPKLNEIQVSVESLKRDVTRFVAQLVEHMKEKKLTHKSCLRSLFKRTFAKKADVFSVGYVLLAMLHNAKQTQCDDTISKYTRFIELVKKTWCLNPYERYTMKEALDEYKKIVEPERRQNIPVIVISDDDEEIKIPSPPSANKLQQCMKHKRKELQEMVATHQLAKSVKYLNKKEMCEKLIPHMKSYRKEDEKKNTTTYVTANNVTANNNNKVSMSGCKKYYTLNELKSIVDEHKLPKKFKLLKKEQLCEKVLPYLSTDQRRKTVKRGPKLK